ncbi:L-serine dehydratase, iron-sulfur-dependent, beta subunit [Enterococcus moraviensis ATCC BAA-383]|uniref:L-serine deaminase n=1 Tax=Enterococcus moraviensis ATCC BAA-383 TaxID=1158609 RepID=R2T661_9ENTE|nr:L-serine ammonia-lyase, iron-sulfur-dependent subunit beta [Enterococcus moraviensis]EOH95759.1 L-serine dehydratase, iron-sulfur-dependent, beta subunit [Enterococcus moraviensis ATCC BAA-383]EOT66246.1 L-serine dehydratase, iron-sulfur-dependent, beta subunit [Enterococcus moraviensis ATCC BAA-383]OJG67689.1 L-serine dehydratase, iron-sulfur-dependent, beta subunit [Enterococcus moraviensis]
MSDKKFKYKSAFDIIGPIMVGPSSSHTAGAVRIGNMARELYKHTPQKLIVTFFGSFAETYKGHGTAVAIVAGVLGFETHDERIPNAIEIAEKQGVKIEFLVSTKETEHANTVNLELIDEQEKLNLTAISIGGGSIQLTEINHHSTLQGNGLVFTTDQESALPCVENALESPEFVEVQQLNKETVFFVETVSDISQKLVAKIREIPGITAVLPTTG